MMLLNKAESLISAIITKIDKTTKPRQKFILHILILFMGLRGKYNFINMARYGLYTEQTYRNQMSTQFDWAGFNMNLIEQSCSDERILAFDPSYLPKAGKKTPHVGRFGSGKDQAVKPGLEIGAIAVVDVQNGTALSLESVQTPKITKGETGENLVDHYAQVILGKLSIIISLNIKYMAVDAFFSKADVKVQYFNQFITDFIFSKLALDMSCEKYKCLYKECLSIGRLAA